ncbi:diacylglycerol/lipid kinase family protein [Tundrisphaera sp. TA3]|uniref:diacylglycerol/lipid kinase family protein n=1 Tax=Tundrisphaera sp. TA3 TaxID=3435775 RepID=UPI003EB8E05A
MVRDETGHHAPWLVILNPRSGTASVDTARRAIADRKASGELDEYELKEGDDLHAVVREALGRGVRLVVAAGGDGTVSSVADVLAGTDASLAIFPMGTTNVLAREMGLPVEPDGTSPLPAAALLDHPESIARIDAMKVAGHHYFTQVGVGIDALMIRDTKDGAKRMFGRAAYLWTAFGQLLGFQPRRFTITADDRTLVVRASEIVVANVGMLGQPPYRWGPGIRPDDGRLSICIVRARNLWHYAQLFWMVARGRHNESPHIRYVESRKTISIASEKPLPVQADGEIIGETPVRIELVPAALRLVVPKP